MRFIKIKKYDYEPEWFIGFTFSNDTITAYQEIYLNDNDLLSFSKELINFPDHKKELTFEVGSDNSINRWAYYFRILIFIYNSSGHTAINVTLNNNQENQLSEKSHFNILCTPADINNLGNQLCNWCSNTDIELYFEFKSDILMI